MNIGIDISEYLYVPVFVYIYKLFIICKCLQEVVLLHWNRWKYVCNWLYNTVNNILDFSNDLTKVTWKKNRYHYCNKIRESICIPFYHLGFLGFSVPDPWNFSGRICTNCERNMYHQKTSKRAKVISNKDVNFSWRSCIYFLYVWYQRDGV